MNEKKMDCEACELQLFEFHEGNLSPEASAEVSEHLEDCDQCSELLNDIWQMGLVATRWQEERVPNWDRHSFGGSQNRWGIPQIVATAASILAVVLVLTDTRFVPEDGGFRVAVGGSQSGDYVKAADFQSFVANQQDQIAQLASRQVNSDQLVLRSVLEASREERKEDLTTLVNYINASQARQHQQTQTNLRYLLASQAEDERDIQQLSQAFQTLNPYPNASGNNM